uniref:Uncharacterized protein n=1 Tax=Rhizophora mucronata TaxID=61149 RepID=A0A2P2KLI1_RHIMU
MYLWVHVCHLRAINTLLFLVYRSYTIYFFSLHVFLAEINC